MQAQFGHIGRVCHGHHIRHQCFVLLRIVTRHHNRLTHCGVFSQSRRDFAQLDTEAPDFDLMIVAAQIVQCAISVPAPHVPSTVHARIITIRKRIGQETFGGQLRAVQIAARYPRTTYVQLTDHADRHRLTGVIQQIEAQIIERLTNRAVPVQLGIASGQRLEGNVNGGFGDAVHIDQLRTLAITGVPRL